MVSSETRRFYPTPSTTRYFIQGVEIDDIFRVDFRRNVQHQPIYGYNSKQYGFIAEGKELVMGSIIINFRYPGYLRNIVLRQLQGKERMQEEFGSKFSTENAISNASLQMTLDDVDMQGSTTDKMAILANRMTEALRTQRVATNNDIVKKLKDVFEQKFYSTTRVDEPTALESPLSTHRAYPFDLSVQYGFHHGNAIPYHRVFRDCVLTGESETVSAAAGAGNDMSSSAQPILETYQFFARTIDTVQGQG
jgi:hypothetical protein